MVRTFNDAAGLTAAVGEELGTSEWVAVTQDRIDEFARATDDYQWIHVDRERSRRGPYGTTIAHGYLCLSLLPALMRQVFRVDGLEMGVLYGLNRVRFITPVRVGSLVRIRSVLKEATEVEGALHLVLSHTLEIQGEASPALVAEGLSRLYF